VPPRDVEHLGAHHTQTDDAQTNLTLLIHARILDRSYTTVQAMIS
jgi:hypothetical protein